MSNSYSYSLVEQTAFDRLENSIERLKSEVVFLQALLTSAQEQIQEHEAQKQRSENYPYKVSLIVLSPQLAQQEREFPGTIDEIVFVENSTEAKAKELEIESASRGIRQKRVTRQAATVKSTPF